MWMKRSIFLLGGSSCPAYVTAVVTFASRPQRISSQTDKTAPLPPPTSCLHFTLMTLHLHLSSVSPSPLHFFLDSHWAVIYMQILKCDCGKGKKKEKEKKKKRTGLLSYRKINIAPAISAGIPLFLSDSAPLIGHGCPERATPAVSNHRLKAEGDGECRVVADGKRGCGG